METTPRNGAEFLDQNCTLTHEGRTFESGGAFLGTNPKTGRMGGVLYASEKTGEVTNWHGDIRIPAYYGCTWRSNMGDTRQMVYLAWEGKNFAGIYYKSGSDIVRVRETR